MVRSEFSGAGAAVWAIPGSIMMQSVMLIHMCVFCVGARAKEAHEEA